LGEAEALAAAADIAIVVVGTNDDWETEGRDRDQFALPGDQPELIRRVCAANPNTVVVLNTGGPHDVAWLDLPAATLSVGFAGQEMGDSLVDVLVGDADPGGRMPTTIPSRFEHAASFHNYPGENSVVRYGEGLFIGHRWFDSRHIEPAVPFGHGMSYATFSWQEPVVVGSCTTTVDEPVIVEVEVTNTSDRIGSEVVQLYIEPPVSTLHRPVRELKGFAKLTLAPGESAVARIELNRRSFAYYDPADQGYEALQRDDSPVPAEASKRHSEPGWYVEPGVYRLVVARSASDHQATIEHELEGAEFHFFA
ncbi:MAG: glycoside hydrolase family 3 C-terminal domain-containing protein, partial [Acidimicrobiales bacterium]